MSTVLAHMTVTATGQGASPWWQRIPRTAGIQSHSSEKASPRPCRPAPLQADIPCRAACGGSSYRRNRSDDRAGGAGRGRPADLGGGPPAADVPPLGDRLRPGLRPLGVAAAVEYWWAQAHFHHVFSCPVWPLPTPGSPPIDTGGCTFPQPSVGWAGAALMAATGIWLIAWTLATRGRSEGPRVPASGNAGRVGCGYHRPDG